MSGDGITSMHVIASDGLGGAENFFVRLTGALAEEGHPVTAVTRRGGEVGDQLAPGVRDERLSMANNFDPAALLGIRGLVRRQRPRIVQTYMSRATTLTRIPRRWGIPFIARLGGYYKLKYFNHAHYWVGNTRGICDYLVRGGLPAERVFHISNFVDPVVPSAERRTAVRHALGIPEDAFVVMGLGRLVPKKGFDLLIDAIDRVTRGDRPLHLLLVGDGRLREPLEAQAAPSGRVHFDGWQTATSPYFAAADLLVCPSREEPLGNVILEGWAHGLPVVSSASAGALELMTDERDGLIVPLDDSAALARRIDALYRDEGLRQTLAQSGRRTLDARHGRVSVVAAYVRLYREILERPGSA